MNIFALDSDPGLAAEYHCDKHVGKMLLETVQLLSTVRIQGNLMAPYKSSYKNHPCTLWVAESMGNYAWLVQLGRALDRQYKLRFKKQHKSGLALEQVLDPPILPDLGVTDFVQVVPDEYKGSCAISAYRKYYVEDKKSFAKWGHSKAPAWMV